MSSLFVRFGLTVGDAKRLIYEFGFIWFDYIFTCFYTGLDVVQERKNYQAISKV